METLNASLMMSPLSGYSLRGNISIAHIEVQFGDDTAVLRVIQLIQTAGSLAPAFILR
jgi:hypothetical protein